MANRTYRRDSRGRFAGGSSGGGSGGKARARATVKSSARITGKGLRKVGASRTVKTTAKTLAAGVAFYGATRVVDNKLSIKTQQTIFRDRGQLPSPLKMTKSSRNGVFNISTLR